MTRFAQVRDQARGALSDHPDVEPRLPSPRALAIGALALAVPGVPWLHARSQRLAVEHRAAAVASALTHRSIAVHCPGPVRKRLFYEIHEGTVMFDADGVPADATSLSAGTCDGLREALDHGPTLDFTCLDRGACPARTAHTAQALAVLTHEIMHLRGTRDEALTECRARQRVGQVATWFGIGPTGGAAIARWQTTVWARQLPAQYQGATC